jgi:hypothetical protein
MLYRAAATSDARRVPMGRAAEPWEIGRLTAFLASEDADYITDQTFTIDGGLAISCGQKGLSAIKELAHSRDRDQILRLRSGWRLLHG